MASERCNKIKLLKLMELLRQQTDAEHPMSANEVCRRLEAMGVSCDRRVLPRDIAVLNGHGYEVMSVMVGHEKAYYVEERGFSVPELKILIDAVQAASFITDKKTEELVDKLAKLGGSHRGDILKSNIVNFNTRKHKNENIYYNVGFLEDAIEQNKKVIFRYYDLDEKGKKVYRREGHHYVAEPVALVFNEDNYYLVSYSEKYENTANYRVDRMEMVEVIDEEMCAEAKRLRNNIGKYTEQAFKMYGGRLENVRLRFANELIGVVYDRFGEDIKVIRSDENNCTTSVNVQLSPTFWGWIFQFGKNMEIVSPFEVAEKYLAKIKEIADANGYDKGGESISSTREMQIKTNSINTPLT